MEGIFLVLVGGALFAQAWYVLGMYSEGRTMGILVGGLGVLALGTVVFAFEPTLLTGVKDGKDIGLAPGALLEQTTVMKMAIVAWSLYAIGVGAHGLWDFDDRAIGFYGGFLAAVTAVVFIYFAIELERVYADAVWLSLSGAALVLTLIAGVIFFYQALQFMVLRLLTGWSLLLGGAAVGIVGLAIVGAAITP